MAVALPWISAFAAHQGLRYEPEPDERWFRAWEPYTTMRVPLRYEHAVHATGTGASLSLARAVVEQGGPAAPMMPREVGTWLAIVQDERIDARVAVSSDFGSPFAEPLELIGVGRRPSRDPAFDHVFASFADSEETLARALTPSLRKLLLSWRTPVHAETRPGGFVVAAVAVAPDAQGLAWMLDAVRVFARKATKRPT